MNIILDGFNHYGSGADGRTAMLAGPYLQVDAATAPDATRPRTQAYSLHWDSVVANPLWRRALPSSRTRVFLGLAHYITNLPSASDRYAFARFLTAANSPIVSFTLSTTGQVQIRAGAMNGTILAESDPVFVAESFQHVECMAYVNGASSAAEARVNGATVVSITGVDLGATPISQFSAGGSSVNSQGTGAIWQADLRVGDDLGGTMDDFTGDMRVYTQMPVADQGNDGWVPDTGADVFARIDEIGPDGDTSYAESDGPGATVRVSFEPLPEAVQLVGGIAFVSYMRKTDAGAAQFANNVVSGASLGLGDVVNPSVDYSYTDPQVFDMNPNGDIPWTPDSVNALASELEHVGST